jgi:hypothetical protein
LQFVTECGQATFYLDVIVDHQARKDPERRIGCSLFREQAQLNFRLIIFRGIAQEFLILAGKRLFRSLRLCVSCPLRKQGCQRQQACELGITHFRLSLNGQGHQAESQFHLISKVPSAGMMGTLAGTPNSLRSCPMKTVTAD